MTLEKVEREIVESPCQNHCANFVVETLENNVVVILEASLPSENSETLEDDINRNCQGGCPPDNWVADEVNLAVVLAPEVDAALEDWPGVRARVPGVRFDKSGVGVVHDLLQLPEFAKEARVSVVDLLCVGSQKGVLVLLHIPDAVWKSSSLSTSNLLLLRCPFRKLDLVGEKNTSSHNMNKLELCLDRSEALLGSLTI